MNKLIQPPAAIRMLHSRFQKAGHQLHLVGGCVRDSLLGEKPKDWDLATDATPPQIEGILGDLHIIPVGEAFGVIRVLIDDEEFEIATFREDIGEGRRPDSVRFSTIEADVQRRDFTINALFFDLHREEVIDLVGGREDLLQRRLRTVGSAKDRFREDPLRKLRAVRFACRFEMEMDEDMIQSIVTDPSLNGVSPERQRDEILKGLRSAQSMQEFWSTLILLRLDEQITTLLPDRTTAFPATDPIAFIAAIFRECNSLQVERELRRLTFTSAEIRDALWLLRLHREGLNEPFELKRTQKTDSDRILQFCQLSGIGSIRLLHFLQWELTVSGDELIAEGWKPGPALGAEIARRENELFNQQNTNK